LRHTRSIISAITGKDARFIIELPGDFEHVKKAWSKEKREQIKKQWNLK